MKNFECFYYKTSSGRCPVEAFINSLSYKTQRKFFAKLDWLEEYGYRLPEPHSKKIEDEIYEFRFEGDDGAVRILYFFYLGGKIIFLSGFKKKQKKIRRKEIELAKRRKEDFLVKLSCCIARK